MPTDEQSKPSPSPLLRVALVLLAVLALGASALAVVQRNQLADERARSDELADDLATSRDRISDLQNEIENGEPQPPPPDDNGGQDPFSDVFGGDVATLLECVGAGGEAEASDSAETARAQVDEISNAVEQLRALRLKHDVDVRFLEPEAVAKKAARITMRDYPRDLADAEGRMLQALGAVPRGTDLRQLTTELIESQVAGFYLPSTDSLFVPGNSTEPLTPGEKVILAHELTHAVAHGQLNIPLPEHPDPADLDEDLAALAIVEGDATLLMQQYALTRLSVFDQLSMTSDPSYQASQDAIEKIPPYLVEQLTYPYVDGLNFTCDLYIDGGWKAVNRAYANPPTTTAQVLFPDRYESQEEPKPTSSAVGPGGGWNEAWHSTFGAANLLWLFKAPGGDETLALSEIEERVSAWAGGTVDVWERGQDTALALRLRQKKEIGDLCASIMEWYDASFDDDSAAQTKQAEGSAFTGEIQSAVVSCPDEEVRLGVGPNLRTARRMVR
jgi:hypothetical protein